MKTILFGSVAALVTFAVGLTLSRAFGIAPHPNAAWGALAAVIFAVICAGVPMVITRRGNQLSVMQAGLVATMIHMLVLIAAAAVVIFTKLLPQTPFVCWLCVLYLMSLIAVVFGVARAIQVAPLADAKNDSGEIKLHVPG